MEAEEERGRDVAAADFDGGGDESVEGGRGPVAASASAARRCMMWEGDEEFAAAEGEEEGKRTRALKKGGFRVLNEGGCWGDVAYPSDMWGEGGRWRDTQEERSRKLKRVGRAHANFGGDCFECKP